MATGEEYNIPFSTDVSELVANLNKMLDSAKEVQTQAAKTRESISEMNKEMVAGAEKSNKALGDQAQNTLNLKKIAEERAKAEKIMIGVLDEISKKQKEGVKLNDSSAAAVKYYTENLEYFKEALKTATDPTQIKVLGNSMERLRDKIVAAYDKASTAITPMNDKLKEAGALTDKLSDSIMGSFSNDELDSLAKDLNNTSNELEQLGAMIDFVSKKMEGLDKESELFKTLSADIEEANSMLGRTSEVLDVSSLSSDQLVDRLKFLQDALNIEANPQEIVKLNKEIEAVEVRLKQIKNAGKEGFDELGNKIIPEAEEKVKSLGSQLEEVIQQMAKMKAEGLGDGKEYDELMAKAVQLKQAISGVKDELKQVASETPRLDGLIEAGTLIASGFNIAQGAMALFGEENEMVEKTIAKLTAGISILQGLQQIQIELKNRESVANKALTASQALYNVVIGASTGALKVFRIALAATGIGLIVLALGYLITNWDKLTDSIRISSPVAQKFGDTIDKIKQVAMGVGNAVLQWLIWPLKTLFVLFTEGASAAVDSFLNSMNIVKNFSQGFNDEIQRQTYNRIEKENQVYTEAANRRIEILKAQGGKERDIFKEELRIIDDRKKVLAEYAKVHARNTKEQIQELIELNQKRSVLAIEERNRLADEAKKAAEDAKKAADKAKRAAEEAERKRQAELKRIREFNNQIKDLEFEKNEARIRQMQDSAEKEKELEDSRYKKEVDRLARELAEFVGTEEEKNTLINSQNALKEQLLNEHLSKMWAIDVLYFDKLVESQKEQDKILMRINKQDKELELSELEDKYKKLEDEWKKTYGDEKDFTEQKNKEIANINLKYSLQELKDREDIETAKISLIKIKGKTEEEEEKIRENLKYKIMRDAAQERLELLRKVGGKENTVAIAQTEALIAELNLKLGTTKKKTNVFQLLGLDVKDDDARQIVESYKQVFSQITQAWQDALSLQIDAKQRQIDLLNDQISEVERALDRELDLQEQGYANNVTAKQQELDSLKAQRDEEARQKAELMKKEQQFAMAQVALNGIVQASEMALAAAKIFKAHAGIPFVGVAIAAAAALTMVATFLAIRNQIKAMDADVPKFRDGGSFLLNGPSHENGGLGVYNEKTGKRVAEVEGGEGFFAINKRSTQKYLPFLQAINNDDLGKVGGLMDDLLEGTGVAIAPDIEKTTKVVVLSSQKQERDNLYKEALLAFAESEELKDIASSNRMLLEIERKRKSVTETETHIIEQQGNIVRRIKKKK